MPSNPSLSRAALLRLSLAAGAACAATLGARRASAGAALLAPGEPVPPLAGTTLGGAPIVLPAASAGKPFALVLSFTRGSAGANSTWSDALLSALTPAANVYAAIVLDSVPGFIRGFVTASIKKDADRNYPSREDHVFITYHGAGWEALLPAGKPDDAGVLLADGHGDVLATAREPYSEAALAALRKTLP